MLTRPVTYSRLREVAARADGFHQLSESESAEYAEQVVAGRMQSPDGPTAPLRTGS